MAVPTVVSRLSCLLMVPRSAGMAFAAAARPGNKRNHKGHEGTFLSYRRVLRTFVVPYPRVLRALRGSSDRSLKIDLHAELQEPGHQDLAGGLPGGAKGVVLQQHRARVEGVVDVDIRPGAEAAELQQLRDPEI